MSTASRQGWHVAVVGLSHKTAPLEERERIAIDAEGVRGRTGAAAGRR